MTGDSSPLVAAHDLVKDYRTAGGLLGRTAPLRAVDHVSLSIRRVESVGLVGESGSGKTTLGRLLLRLIEPTSGSVVFDGIDVCALDREPLRALRRRMQIVFQDPYGSLNPRMTVGTAVREPLEAHKMASRSESKRAVTELFEEVGLDPAYVSRYPHELSGGQRQRVGIARALALKPEFMILDEPVSALDVSVQAQVLNLLVDLRESRGLTYLFIAHDLAVVRHIAHRVVVMYLGKLVEAAPADAAYTAPLHPYTAALLSAVPAPDPRRQRERIVLKGDMPDPRHPPTGCVFHPRCPHPAKDERCRVEIPAFREVSAERRVACHYVDNPLRLA